MNEWTVWLYFGLFIILILLEMPIGTAMVLSSLFYIVENGQSFVMFAQKTATSFASYSLLAVPAFIFVGCAMNEIGFSDRIFGVAEKSIGHIPGGLGHANVLASMIFAGMSGSAMADAGGLGAIEIKAMNDAGYDKSFSVAITAASSGIGPIIPPSINLVVWGFLAGSSTVELFMAGILPGILMGLCLMVYIYIAVTRFHVKAPITPRATFKEFLHALWRGLPALGAPVILLGGISTGIFTSTETGAVACAYIIILGLFYRRLNWNVVSRKPDLAAVPLTPEAGLPEPMEQRKVLFDREEEFLDTNVYRRDELRPGTTVYGPAILEQMDSTCVIPPHWSAYTDAYRNIIAVYEGVEEE